MLKEMKSITIKGANFQKITQLPILCGDANPAKAVLLYGKNGSGKSTIARAFRKLVDLPASNIQIVSAQNDQGTNVVLSETDKKHIYIFDEDYINDNVRVQEDSLGAIVMLGEQAGLAGMIEQANSDLRLAESERDRKKALFDEFSDSSNQKSPKYYLNKIHAVLQQDDGWAGRKRKIEQLRRNASVSDNTYRDFLPLSPEKSRDELIVEYDHEWSRLEAAQSGTSKITATIPHFSQIYELYDKDSGNELLHQVIEHPKLTEREQYLLNLVQTGHGEELRNTAQEFEEPAFVVCPKCHQPLTRQYKSDLIDSIQKVLSEEVKNHQSRLSCLLLSPVETELEPFQNLNSYQVCLERIAAINQCIEHNNGLIQAKIVDPYTPIGEELSSLEGALSALEEALEQLESEKAAHNRAVTDISSIKIGLTKLNNEIAHWDIIELSRQHDIQQAEEDAAQGEYNSSLALCSEKRARLDALNAQRDSIDIAIDLINEGLKYIFFYENRMQISVEGHTYRLKCNGQSVKPKDISVGERNIIGLCYYFASILEGKSREEAYSEEYLLIIDDPVSSYDLENRVGILSYLKYELSKFLLGNVDSRALVMTHDLFTAYDVSKMLEELMESCNQRFNGQGSFKFSQKELRDKQIIRLTNKRNEYTTLLEEVFDFGNGGAADHGPYIGNIIRQVLEAFSTFEYRKGIEKVSTDDEILSAMESEEHQRYFKNLMYRLVLNEGSHRLDQTRNMHVDFFSIISDVEKRRTAKEILCFMDLLNAPHIKSQLGAEKEAVIKSWCENIH